MSQVDVLRIRRAQDVYTYAVMYLSREAQKLFEQSRVGEVWYAPQLLTETVGNTSEAHGEGTVARGTESGLLLRSGRRRVTLLKAHLEIAIALNSAADCNVCI
ncbi:hypothetical protein GCM10023190_26250 [Enteractinococcus fodinae]|uniref:Uncharacterized protein n=1 Tax=Enteractinococcus fodinae TaxID=684663 RepID=A0ABU2B2W2_9MICC|nr:hypothetical protein [Enteractinococcus fodinae]MDR7347611.1 hypothetical protein [Enteractinococcus fodinae]